MCAEGRVENQKLNQTTALVLFRWVFGFQLDFLEKNLVSLAGFTFTVVNIFGDLQEKDLVSLAGFTFTVHERNEIHIFTMTSVC